MDSAVGLQAVLVGKESDEFIRYVRSVLEDFEVRHLVCEDVYTAVGRLAKLEGADVLVVGRFEDLSKKGGRFFEMARQRRYICCCYVEGERIFRGKGVFEAAQAGALILQKPSQAEQVISKLLARAVGSSIEKEAGENVSGLIADEFRLSEGELEALLERPVDEEW